MNNANKALTCLISCVIHVAPNTTYVECTTSDATNKVSSSLVTELILNHKYEQLPVHYFTEYNYRCY